MKTLKAYKVQNVSSDCVVCGTHNEFSLGCKFFELDDNIIVATLKAKNHHQSYPGRMHGGMISAIIDETIGRAVQIEKPEQWGVTGELTIRYIKPTPLGQELHCFAKLVQENSRLFKGVAILETQTGELVATGSATYFKLDIAKITEGFGESAWYSENIEIPKEFIIHNDEILYKLVSK